MEKRWLWLCVGLWAGLAGANERRFTHAYETAVLAPGVKELEISEEGKLGREEAYVGLKHRFEVEMGVVPNLQTSIYVNLESTLEGEQSIKASELEWSLSNEWKWKLLDAVADPVGLGLYGEMTVGYREIELEAKLLLDKRVGRWHAVFNAVGEHEWELTTGAPNLENKLEGDLGLAYFFSPQLSAGLELFGHSIFSGDEGYEGTAFYVGPAVTYATETFWITGSFMPQFAGLQGEEAEEAGISGLELEHHERFNARVLMGFHL